MAKETQALQKPRRQTLRLLLHVRVFVLAVRINPDA